MKLDLCAGLDGARDFSEAPLVAAGDVLRRCGVSRAVEAVVHVNYGVRLNPHLCESLADTWEPINDCLPWQRLEDRLVGPGHVTRSAAAKDHATQYAACPVIRSVERTHR